MTNDEAGQFVEVYLALQAERLRRATDRHRQQVEASELARTDLHKAIADAARKGTPQKEIVRATGYTRERIRQICRAAGVDVLALPPQPREVNPR